MPPGTYVPRLVVSDGNGCKVASFLTIQVTGDAEGDGDNGGPVGSPVPNANNGTPNGLTGGDCGQGSACGVSGGGLITMICGFAGLLGRRRRRKSL
jgi:hypothetical protein